MSETIQPISPILTIVSELVSAGVMGIVAAMWWVAYREERKRSKELADGVAEMGKQQTEAIIKMTNAVTGNSDVIKETKASIVANTELTRSLSEQLAIYTALHKKDEG